MAIEERKGANELIERDGLIVRVGGGKLRAGGEASAEREKKQRDGEEEGLQRRTGANRSVIGGRRGNRAPVKRGRGGGACIVSERVGHERFGGSD